MDVIQTVLAALPTDPASRANALGELLGAWPAVHARIREERQAAVVAMHETGMSWAQIGAELDLHPQRVSQIAKGVTGGKKREAEAE